MPADWEMMNTWTNYRITVSTKREIWRSQNGTEERKVHVCEDRIKAKAAYVTDWFSYLTNCRQSSSKYILYGGTIDVGLHYMWAGFVLLVCCLCTITTNFITRVYLSLCSDWLTWLSGCFVALEIFCSFFNLRALLSLFKPLIFLCWSQVIFFRLSVEPLFWVNQWGAILW